MEGIENKIAKSGLITLDFEEVLNFPIEITVLDIKEFLFQGLLLKEKEYRTALKELDWSVYKTSVVALQNSNDAIVPKWAFMLLATHLNDNCIYYSIGSKEEVEKEYLFQQILDFPFEDYKDKRVILKGCGDKEIHASVYMHFTNRLIRYVKTLMYGEPCSTVPVYKKK